MSRLASVGLLFTKAASEWMKDNALRLSAAVSFFSVLSLAPMLAIIIRVMAYAHETQFARRQLIEQATYIMGPEAAAAIRPIIDGTTSPKTAFLPTLVTTLILLYSSTSVFIELQDAMNSIWGVQARAPKKSRTKHVVLRFIRQRLLSLLMVFCLGFLLVFSIFLSALLTASQRQLELTGRWPAILGGIAASFVVQFLLFSAIFKFLPNVRVGWRNVWLGAFVAALLFTAGRAGLAVYFKHSNLASAYGAAGSLVAVLTWIYYSCFSLFYGAEITKVWTKRATKQNKN